MAHYLREGGLVDVIAQQWALHPDNLAEILNRHPRDGFAEDTTRLVRHEAGGRHTHTLTRGCLVLALSIKGPNEEAAEIAEGMVDDAETTRNPGALSLALLAFGFALRDTDPARALAALRRGLAIAQDTGNRTSEGHLASVLCRVEAKYGDPLAGLNYFGSAIHHHESGNTIAISTPLAMLAAFFYQLGRYEAAATTSNRSVMISRNRSAPSDPATSIECTTSANKTVTCLYSAAWGL